MIIPELSDLTTGTKKSQWYISKHYPEFALYIESTCKFTNNWAEKLYCYFHNITEQPLCFCGNPVKFYGFRSGYAKYCSTKCANASPDKKNKTIETCLKKYGVTNVSKDKSVRNKRKHIFLKKYGSASPLGNEKIRQKCQRTLLDHYGVDNPNKSDIIRQKTSRTNMERYGVTCTLTNPTIKEKANQTMLSKYGTLKPMGCDAIRSKVFQTNNSRYGGNSPFSCEEVRNKASQTINDRYGVDNVFRLPTMQDRIKNTMRERYGVNNAFKILSDESKQKAISTNLERYGVPYFCLTKECRMHSNDSKPNQRFASLLDKCGIAYEREFVIGGFAYDFKVENTLIEINPYPTHNSTWGIHGTPKEKTYHQNKTLLAEQNGYSCIHVWDWDDLNRVIQLISNHKSIGARNCQICEITSKEANKFIDKYHLQGKCRGQSICIALKWNDEIVGVMTFGKSRYNKQYEYELLRLCFGEYIVNGGAEKMFKYFVRIYQPSSIISYCDRSKFRGHVYKKLGFVANKMMQPSKHWFNGKMHITNNLLRQRGFDQLFNTNYGKGSSNEQLMIDHKFVEIYDCGQQSWCWKS